MKLKATRHDYEFSDESGYRFTVTASFDPEFGWSADVQMASHGMRTAEDAIEFLANPVKAFLRQLKDARPSSPKDGQR